MESTRRTGRVVGLLLLVHLVVGLMAPFILLDRVGGTAGLLASAAGSPVQFRIAALMLVVGSAMAVAVSAAGWPVFRLHSEPTAFALLGLAAAAFSLQVVDTAALWSILAASREHARPETANDDLQALAAVLGAGRRWLHYSYLLVAVSWILLLKATFLRFRLIPRALAALGVAACLSQLAGVSIPGLLGITPVFVMAMPMAPVYLGVAGWLMVKGFADQTAASVGRS